MTMPLQMIPLNNSPNQSFTVQLSVDGLPLTLNLSIRFNSMAGYWLLTISDASNKLLIDSVPMITGSYPAANLLKQQKYLKIGSWYIINVSNLLVEGGSGIGYGEGFYGGGPYGGGAGMEGIDYPNQTNLGSDFQLWVGDTPTV
jgi:hypothetical protein